MQDLVLDRYQFTHDWFSGNIPIWMTHLSGYIGKSNLKFVEVGCWEGRSTVWLLDNILTDGSCTLHCVDTWESPNVEIGEVIERRFDHNAESARENAKCNLIKLKGRSVEILPLLDKDSIDFIYIDGSHLAKDVLSDLVLSWRLLRIGGIVACDDYELKEGLEIHEGYEIRRVIPPIQRPKMAIDAFLQCFEDHYRILHQGWQVLLQKTRG